MSLEQDLAAAMRADAARVANRREPRAVKLPVLVALWRHGFDTTFIARHLHVTEDVVHALLIREREARA